MATSYDGECIQGSLEDSGVLHLRMARAPVNAANSQFFFEIGHYFELAKVDLLVASCASSHGSHYDL
jgi:cyclophilin family peptidyl-prolyl cis-trans isomerase